MERKSVQLTSHLAQRKGFEPLDTSLHHTISNRARSTTPPSLQASLLYMILPKKAIVFAVFSEGFFLPPFFRQSPSAQPRSFDFRNIYTNSIFCARLCSMFLCSRRRWGRSRSSASAASHSEKDPTMERISVIKTCLSVMARKR